MITLDRNLGTQIKRWGRRMPHLWSHLRVGCRKSHGGQNQEAVDFGLNFGRVDLRQTKKKAWDYFSWARPGVPLGAQTTTAPTATRTATPSVDLNRFRRLKITPHSIYIEYTSWPMSGTPLNRNRCRLGAGARAGPQGYFVKPRVRVGEGEGEEGGNTNMLCVKKLQGLRTSLLLKIR